MCQNLDYLRILALYSDLQNSTCKYSYRPWEVIQLFSPRCSHMDPHRARQKCCDTLHAFRESLHLEFFRFVKFQL
jgi:hypothetical protein